MGGGVAPQLSLGDPGGRETLIQLCGKYGIPVPNDTRGMSFEGFGPFAEVYIAVCECLREASDLDRLVLEVAQDAKQSPLPAVTPATQAAASGAGPRGATSFRCSCCCMG